MELYVAESDRLWLQRLTIDEHLNDYHLLLTEPKSVFWSSKGPIKTHEETLLRLQQSSPTPGEPWKESFAILLRCPKGQKPKMIGVVGTGRESEVGYKVHPDFSGKGYMTEALKLFTSLFFILEANKSFNRLNAAADPANLASIRVLEKAGFTKGEYKKAAYQRTILEGQGKSDLQFFYFPKPGQ
ncbi:GNAT domain-containing protein [Tricladium varicosporioides]|nr:GNAT domain-containing protein [Hymenoscyphus varicosporioides]